MILGNNLTIIPIIHGKVEVAKFVRELFNTSSFDLVALPLPQLIEEEIVEIADLLPAINTIVLQDGDTIGVIPADPCDPFIEAVRQSSQKRIPLQCIGADIIEENKIFSYIPDEYLIKKLGYYEWATVTLASLLESDSFIEEIDSFHFLVKESKRIDKEYSNPVLFLEIEKIPTFVKLFNNLNEYTSIEPKYMEVQISPINPAHLYFILGELPFITGEYEKNRSSLFEINLEIEEVTARLFLETKDSYTDSESERAHFSLTRLQQGLKFLRNLMLLDGRVTPSLFNLLTAAKGIGGDSFALKLFKASNYYPYYPPITSDFDYVSIGIDQKGKLLIKLPNNPSEHAINLLDSQKKEWKDIKLKPDKEVWDSKKQDYKWNPHGQCSYIPEDIFIENFNSHVRNKSLKILSDEHSKSEEFTTSIKDGIDIRETIRNWHSGKIYVKEVPYVNARVDTIVVIFDEDHDEKYSFSTTWYAEHENESTLSFYATNPFENIIGPGIGKSYYGGFSLLYPPKKTPPLNDFVYYKNYEDYSLAVQLTLYALYYSEQKVVTYISDKVPSIFLKTKATEMGKRLLWIPLSSFSGETIRKLRKFHMLNGFEVRNWAEKFIGD